MWRGRFVGRWQQRSSTGHQRDHTARRYAQARSLLSSGVSLSVRLSVTLEYCIPTAEDIVKLLVRPCSRIILVVFFDSSTRTHSAGSKNTRGWVNFAIFNWNHRLSRKWYEIDLWLLWNVNRKSLVRIDIYRFQWPSVTSYPDFSHNIFWSWISQNSVS